uniref:Uncharacterized protein n=1 Tax=Physcomitrium patens TaxID=3218 RepID=A0A2K1IDA3_PHYPA|nr:hypothetical protein PHYPA_029410 [Physcomitrium patens]
MKRTLSALSGDNGVAILVSLMDVFSIGRKKSPLSNIGGRTESLEALIEQVCVQFVTKQHS